MSEARFHDNPVGFCGEPLWDNFVPLYNTTGSPLTQGLPTLTQCFQHTILAWTPLAFFWLLAPVLVLQLRLMNPADSQSLPWTALMSVKWGITVTLLCDKTFLVLLAALQTFVDGVAVPTVEILSPALQMITLAAILGASEACRRRGVRSSGILFCTWLLLAIFGAPEFYYWLRVGSDQELVSDVDFFRYVAYLAWYPLVLLQLLLVCFADPHTLFKDEVFDDSAKNCPEVRASFLNRQTLYWFGSLISQGNKKKIEVDDLFDLSSDMKAEDNMRRWQPVWANELEKNEKRIARWQQQQHGVVDDRRGRAELQTSRDKVSELPLLPGADVSVRRYGGTEHRGGGGGGGKAAKAKESSPRPLPSLITCLWRVFKWEILAQIFFKLVSDLLQFANPIFLDLLITFTEDPSAPWQLGLLYAIGMFSAAQLRSFFTNSFFLTALSTASRINGLLMLVVYEKTLKLSSSARRAKTHGEIVNLMSIDVDRMQRIIPQLQQYWSSPLQISLTLAMLYSKVGWAAVAGIIVMLSLIPLNGYISKVVKRYQTRLMKLKDERIRMTSEVLNGIKVVKLYAWEPAMESTIDNIRRQEVALIRKTGVIKAALDVANVTSPFVVALSTFAVYTLSDPTGHTLGPQVAFVSLTLFNQLRGPLMMAAELIGQTVQMVVSNKRLKEFLVADELKEDDIDKDDIGEDFTHSIDATDASFTWGEHAAEANLRDLSMTVGNGQLLAIVGRVGGGKSSLLSALLGEMHKLRGYVGVRGRVAYVPQQPWIQNATLRENIVMDAAFDQSRYQEVVEACALRPDFQLLPSGDATEIGEKGINLSGGQKARVALARAVYQDRDVYLLDDPLSAVDSHVARHIFDRVIGPQGILAKKTRLLVTHGLTFLKETDVVIIMSGGQISHTGRYDVLVEDEEVAHLLKEAAAETAQPEQLTPSSERSSDDDAVGRLADADVDAEEAASIVSGRSKISTAFRRSISVQSKKSTTKSATGKAMNLDFERGVLIEKEETATGRVKISVYTDYLKSMGVWNRFVPFILAWTASMLLQMTRAFWLTDWSNDNLIDSDPAEATPLSVRILVYAAVGIGETVFLYLGIVLLVLGAVRASLRLHAPLLHNILRAPLAFFDVTPLGRILNRLGKDMETIDLIIGQNFKFVCVGIINMTQTLTIISTSQPFFIAFLIPIIAVYVLVLRYYISSARQLQRLSSINRSPIYSHFGESIQGASTIRAFGWAERFTVESRKKINTYTRCSWFYQLASRWLGIRLESLGNSIILVTSMLAVGGKALGDNKTAGLIGLSISYSLNVSFMMNMLMRQLSELETSIVAVERVKEYSEGNNEAEWRNSRRRPPKGWPTAGELVFKSYFSRYRPGLDLVLRGIDARILSGEKVGVVGRTGAGKSSLTLALFRIMEPAGGQLLIDDIDVATIGLHDLRERLSIIPQEPVLFSGTLRFNLDPTGEHADDEVWQALKHAHLESFVARLPDGLNHHVDEGGENMSVGQRQLVCLTRAILRRSQLLVLDEATAAVDAVTDGLIQKTIRDVFESATVITIAHRLNTIMDYDKIMVLEEGRIAEFDAPSALLANERSIFAAMAKAAKAAAAE